MTAATIAAMTVMIAGTTGAMIGVITVAIAAEPNPRTPNPHYPGTNPESKLVPA
jgi:hypothetical protein